MIWKNRKNCVNRIATIYLNVLPSTPNADPLPFAMLQAVHKKDGDGFRYVDDPDTMSDRQLENLKMDAQVMIDKLRKLDKIRHKAYAKAAAMKK